jgi:uncharacterized protein
VTPEFQALFLPGTATPTHATGQRFALHHPPAGRCQGSVLFLHAFAEEMNKSRRMVAMAARALAGAGLAVLQIDLLGCGDSSGDLADASWAAWLDDTCQGAAWLHARYPGPLWLWGERSGCLLAAAALPRVVAARGGTAPTVASTAALGVASSAALNAALNAASSAASPATHLLFWQPQTQGKLVLQQFLRLKMASQMQQGQQEQPDHLPPPGDNGPAAATSATSAATSAATPPTKGITEALLTDLAQGRFVDVAGYRLGPAVAQGLAAATLLQPPPAPVPGSRLVWLETTSRMPAALLPASTPALAKWQAAGWAVTSAAVAGPPFWQTVEIEVAPALVQATVAVVLGQALPTTTGAAPLQATPA